MPTLAAARLKPSVGVPLYATVQSISVALDAVQFCDVIDAGGESATTVERGFCQVTNAGSALAALTDYTGVAGQPQPCNRSRPPTRAGERSSGRDTGPRYCDKRSGRA